MSATEPQSLMRDTLPGREPRSMRMILEPPPPASPRAAIAIGFGVGIGRFRRRSAALAALLGLALVVTGALVARVSEPAAGVSSALGATFNVVLPLLAFAAVAELTDRGRLDEAAWPAARFGVARRDVALGLVAAALFVVAPLGALLAVVSALIAHGPVDPPLVHDAFTCGWIGALTAAAYVAWFSFGATFFSRGRGRWLPLVIDFAFGASTGIAGAILPRGNAENLLGGAAPLGLPQSTSTLLLAAMTLLLASGAAVRCRD